MPKLRPALALNLAALVLVGCAATDDREAQCQEQGLVPGTAAMLACKDPEKTEILLKAKESWNSLDRGR